MDCQSRDVTCARSPRPAPPPPPPLLPPLPFFSICAIPLAFAVAWRVHESHLGVQQHLPPCTVCRYYLHIYREQYLQYSIRRFMKGWSKQARSSSRPSRPSAFAPAEHVRSCKTITPADLLRLGRRFSSISVPDPLPSPPPPCDHLHLEPAAMASIPLLRRVLFPTACVFFVVLMLLGAHLSLNSVRNLSTLRPLLEPPP